MTSNRWHPDEWLELYDDAFDRYAMTRIHDEPLAENLVQETLMAGLKGHKRFAGNSSEKPGRTPSSSTKSRIISVDPAKKLCSLSMTP